MSSVATRAIDRRRSVFVWAAAGATIVALAVAGFLVFHRHQFSDGLHAIPVALAATSSSGHPVYEMFLKLDNMQGGSTDQYHMGQLVVDSYAWDVTRPVSSTKPSLATFTVTMPASKASPQLLLQTAANLKINRGTLAVRTAGSGEDFLKWVLTDVRIISYKTVGNTYGDGVNEQIVLSAGRVETEFREILPGNILGSTVKAGWDQRTNSAVQY